jgi:hypothetical protein
MELSWGRCGERGIPSGADRHRSADRSICSSKRRIRSHCLEKHRSEGETILSLAIGTVHPATLYTGTQGSGVFTSMQGYRLHLPAGLCGLKVEESKAKWACSILIIAVAMASKPFSTSERMDWPLRVTGSPILLSPFSVVLPRKGRAGRVSWSTHALTLYQVFASLDVDPRLNMLYFLHQSGPSRNLIAADTSQKNNPFYTPAWRLE